MKNTAYVDLPLKLPCGRCRGCRLDKSLEWAIRCVHEASMYEKNSFITLTYSDKHLPQGKSLCLPDFQKFMKRLRKEYGPGIRFYHCGEYGEKLGRPHYHACLFNHDFPDKTKWKRTRNGDLLYRSASLESLWPYGYSSTGTVTFQSAAYVARYIMKKVTGPKAAKHYEIELPWGGTGEYTKYQRKPEYTTMSRMPGIGTSWIEKYGKTDVYAYDTLLYKGRNKRIPRFYDDKYEAQEPEKFREIKHKRKITAKKFAADNTPERLAVREIIKEIQHKQLKREIDQ